jgi:hypothetical protein
MPTSRHSNRKHDNRRPSANVSVVRVLCDLKVTRRNVGKEILAIR